jgi:DNA polymerase I-like protein with 3'-5' exonuclease and polymerase domains
LVNGIPIDPDVYENADNRDKQDTFLSGKRKGELKFAKVEVRGELKTKIQDFLYVFERKTAPEKEWKTEQQDPNGNPYYSTGSDVIEELSLRSVPFLKALARKQKLSKEVGTYYFTMHPKKGASGMLTMVQAHDRMLHHNLNHTLTVTTRLSSSSPNLQNIPRAPSQAKRMFVSRFTEAYCKEHGLPYYGPDTGVCIEADYSQLEVVVQGVLSGDKALCADLVAKIDFHCKRVSAKFKITYEEALDWCKNEQHPDYKAGKAARTGCKEFSFQRAYGAGAKAIAYQTGMTVEDIEQMIEAEERMYPGVIKFNELVEAKVKKSARPFQSQVNGVWRTFRRGFWQAPTGTIYSFSTKDAPEWLKKRGIADSFMPTELKNYPVQGTGGEIVQAMLGRLWRWLVSKDFFGGKAFLTNTVHDCVWLDCHADVVDEVAQAIKDILESVTEYFNERYGMKITVPFPVEVEVGPNMLDLKHWHPVDPP